MRQAAELRLAATVPPANIVTFTALSAALGYAEVRLQVAEIEYQMQVLQGYAQRWVNERIDIARQRRPGRPPANQLAADDGGAVPIAAPGQPLTPAERRMRQAARTLTQLALAVRSPPCVQLHPGTLRSCCLAG